MPSDIMKMKAEGDVEALIEVVLDEETASLAAVRYLGELGDPRAVNALCKALDRRGHASAAAEALGLIGDARAVEPLTRALHKDDYSLRPIVAAALAKCGPEGHSALVAAAAQDGEAEVRGAAVMALRNSEHPGALDAVVASLNDEGQGVKGAAIEAMWGPVGRGVRDERAVAPLVSLVRNGDDSAATLLERFGDIAVPALLEAARDKTAPGRTLVFQTLWKIGDERALDTFVDGLRDSAARYMSEHGLRSILGRTEQTDDRVFSKLQPLVNDDDEWIRETVTTLFEQFGGQSRLPHSADSAQAGSEVVQLSGSSAQEELANFAALVDRQSALLDGIQPVAEGVARSVFAGLGIDEPNRYDDAVSAFSGFRQYAMTAEGAPVQVSYLKLLDVSADNDFLYVHLVDVPALGFLVCATTGGGFLGYYKTGSQLKEALGL